MRRVLLALTLAVAACLSAEGQMPVRPDSPALNPVTFLAAPTHAPLTLIRDGEPQVVVVSDTAAEANLPAFQRSVQPAVAALQEAFQQVTGGEVRAVDVGQWERLPAGQLVILVGRSRATAALGIDPTTLPREGFLVRTFERGVAIVGRDGGSEQAYKPLDPHIQDFRLCGTLWGVQDFLERFLGLRYYYPGPGVVVPTLTTLTVPPVAYTDHPTYPERSHWNLFHEFGRDSENWPWDREEFPPDWRAFREHWRLANASRYVAAHTPNHWAEVHGQDKPELFYRDAAGKLYLDPKSFADTVYDVSRRETAEQYVADVRRFYDTGWDAPWKDWHSPNDEYVPWGTPDNYVVVENERTRELLTPERGKYGVMSEVMARYYGWLGELVAQQLPGKTVSGYCYAHHRLPPLRLTSFPTNVALQQCHFSQLILFGNPTISDFELGVTKRWAELLPGRLRTYVYLTQESQEYPALGEIPNLVQYFARFGPYTQGVTYDGGGPWSQAHLNLYVAYRLLWNPRFNVQAALDEYYTLMYGAAAPAMKRLTETEMARWSQYEVKLDPLSPMVHTDRDQVYTRIYPAPVVRQLRSDLDAASEAVPPDSLQATRIEFVQQGLARFFAESDKRAGAQP